jgi:hypothetical protein
MSRFTLHMDVSGRVSRSTKGHEIATIGGFSVETEKVDSARENLPKNLPKWEKASISDVKKVSEYICKNAIYVTAFCLEKNTEEWSLFWEDAETYHQKIASASKMRTGYVKAANVIRYWLFGQCAAPLLAETIKRMPSPTILDAQGLMTVEVDIVCDSDIQGKDNIEAFKACWEQFEKSQKKTKQLGLRIILKDVRIMSEQDEPLIVIADYIAGICNAFFGAGKVTAPNDLDLDKAKAELDKIKDAGKIIVTRDKFNLNYKGIFTNFEDI